MFLTEHLEGRIHYETNQVVCFNIYLKPSIAKDFFVCQALLSLVNGSRSYVPTMVVVNNIITFDSATIAKEISEGISNYIEIRKELALTPPYDTKQ